MREPVRTRTFVGVLGLAAAALCAEQGWLHARGLAALGEICGVSPAERCAWCAAAAALAITGLFALSPAQSSLRRRARARRPVAVLTIEP